MKHLPRAVSLLVWMWLSLYSVNGSHAQGALALGPQLTASATGARLFKLEYGSNTQRIKPRKRRVAGPFALLFPGAGVFAASYLIAGVSDLGRLMFSSSFSDPEHGETCDYCKTPRTLLIPVAGPLLRINTSQNPFSNAVCVALGIAQGVGLAMFATGFIWLRSELSGRPTPRHGFVLMPAPIPNGVAITLQAVF